MLFKRILKSPSFEKIRSQILSRWVLKSKKNCSVIAMTSRLRREGVTTVTRGLARSFRPTYTGKILLVYAGRKHPRRASILDVIAQQDLGTLSEYIIPDKKLGCDTVRLANTSQDSINVSPSSPDDDDSTVDIQFDDDGTLLEDSFSLNRRYELTRRIFRQFKTMYNIILVDAGSLNNPNGIFWLLNSDVNILVIDCLRTTRESLDYQRREFENLGFSIDGSILNKRKFPIPNFLYWLVK